LVDVRIVGVGGAPVTVVEKAIELRDERAREAKRAERKGTFGPPAFDEVWCVFDIEQDGYNPSLPKAISIALGNELQLALSNPAFEFWFLLHFEHTTRPFANGKKLVHALKQHLCNYI